MRFTSIVAAGAFALFANAQSTTSVSSAASTTIDAAQASQSALQAEMIKCIEACTPGDVACTSKCIAVPNPSDSQVNNTNNCVGNCPKGNGTEPEVAAYQKCVQDCINSNYFTATAGTPSPTGSSGSDNNNNNNNNDGNNNGDGSSSGSGSGNGNTNPSGTSGNGASGTESGAAATSSTGAASQLMQVSGSAVGILGFLAAVMAL
ncbi:uncharacterized protein B0T15DRAFT_22299 [Chaetomium strumarium]|uniref:Uncharacterized protein n=1 Tax=Chaetomium strumarium TaxID=1170767 RepID=A0AAJ0H1Y7_9PEZI|nr:hypothetical protein B0T15DRAFT_22299 [Chaetomium strumarium]